MPENAASPVSAQVERPAPRTLHLGDLVIFRANDGATLCEVIRVKADGLVRVRGVTWPSGYSVLLPVGAVQAVSGLLRDKP